MNDEGELKLYEVRDVEMSPVDSATVMDYGWTVVVDYADYEKLKNSSEELLGDTQQKLAIKTDEWRLAVLQMKLLQDKWEKERKGMCQAVTRANKARNAMGRWTVAIQNENDLLRLMLKDRGINADFMWKAKRAMEKLEEIKELVAGVVAQADYGNEVDWQEGYQEILEVFRAE